MGVEWGEEGVESREDFEGRVGGDRRDQCDGGLASWRLSGGRGQQRHSTAVELLSVRASPEVQHAHHASQADSPLQPEPVLSILNFSNLAVGADDNIISIWQLKPTPNHHNFEMLCLKILKNEAAIYSIREVPSQSYLVISDSKNRARILDYN